MSKLTRRDFIAVAGASASALALSSCGQGGPKPYPSEDISFIIPAGAGGGFDTFARVLAPPMQRYLPNNPNVVPVNIAAGGGGKGVTQLYRADPNGYTIGILDTPAIFILEQRTGNAFDTLNFTWLCTLGEPQNYALGVRTESPVKNLDDLIALGRERPIKFTTTGPEGTSYMAAVIGTRIIGIEPQFITGYKGSSDFVVGAIRGDGDAVIAAVPTLRPMVDSGQLRILATFEKNGTFGDDVPDATDLNMPELSEVNAERLLAAPPDLPPDIAATLLEAVNKSKVDPQVQAWADSTGYVKLRPTTSEEAMETIRAQAAFFDKWKSYFQNH